MVKLESLLYFAALFSSSCV